LLVSWSKSKENQSLESVIESAWTAWNQSMAQHYTFGWIMVLFVYWWSFNLARSRRNCAREGTTHCLRNSW
jgi:hypothetical protein